MGAAFEKPRSFCGRQRLKPGGERRVRFQLMLSSSAAAARKFR
jgi:hypothetical protein